MDYHLPALDIVFFSPLCSAVGCIEFTQQVGNWETLNKGLVLREHNYRYKCSGGVGGGGL